MQLVEVRAELVAGPNLRGDLRKRARGIGRELGQVSFVSLEARVKDRAGSLSGGASPIPMRSTVRRRRSMQPLRAVLAKMGKPN